MKYVLTLPLLLAMHFMSDMAAAQTFMTEEEMLNTLPGAKLGGISSSDGKTPWEQTYGAPENGKSGGKGKGLWDSNAAYSFTWKVKNGQWCEYWKNGKACWEAVLIDDTTIQMYKKGKKMSQVWKILEPAPGR